MKAATNEDKAKKVDKPLPSQCRTAVAFELSDPKKKSNLKTSLYFTALSAMLLTFNHAKKQKAFRTGSEFSGVYRTFICNRVRVKNLTSIRVCWQKNVPSSCYEVVVGVHRIIPL